MKSHYTSNILIIGVATVIGGIINYIVHPLAVRHLSVADFGQFAALLSMVNIIGFIISAGSVITLKLIAQHNHSLEFMYYLKHQLQRPLLGVGLVLWVVLSLIAHPIAAMFNITNSWAVVLMLASLTTSIYGIILSAIMQSAGRFKTIAGLGVVGAGIRLASVAGVLRWFGNTSSAIAAVLGSGLIIFIITEILVSHRLRAHQDSIHHYEGTLMHQVRSYAKSYVYLILVTVMIGILTNADVLLVQHFFGGDVSGVYAGVAVIAKFVVFIGLAGETVLLPKLFTTQTPTSRSQVSMIVTVLWGFSAIALLGSWLVGPMVLALLKPGLELYAHLLVLVVLINCFILNLSITSKTLVNRGSTSSLWVLGGGTILWYLLGTLSTTLDEFVYRSIIVLTIMTITLQSQRIYQSRQPIF